MWYKWEIENTAIIVPYAGKNAATQRAVGLAIDFTYSKKVVCGMYFFLLFWNKKRKICFFCAATRCLLKKIGGDIWNEKSLSLESAKGFVAL